MSQFSSQYNLSERTSQFSEAVVRLCQTVKQNSVSNPIIVQLVKSATSIGANYAEANGASSKRDFANKIFICKKEAQETKYWLRLFHLCAHDQSESIVSLEQECQELVMIFQKITTTLRSKSETLQH